MGLMDDDASATKWAETSGTQTRWTRQQTFVGRAGICGVIVWGNPSRLGRVQQDSSGSAQWRVAGHRNTANPHTLGSGFSLHLGGDRDEEVTPSLGDAA